MIRLVRLISVASAIALCASVPARAQEETVGEALCRLIESSAAARHLPRDLFTRLIWRESSFRRTAVSPKGAQGVAQFMPRTAAERGLADPFDPEQAIPASASFLFDLVAQFGNFGLAAAAYNAGPARVANWLDAKGGPLPQETRDYVLFITGRSVEDWAVRTPAEQPTAPAPGTQPKSCLEVVATIRKGLPGLPSEPVVALAPFAPWGVQLAGNFSKAIALASYARARQHYAAIIGDLQPMIIGTRLRSRGTRAFYRVRVPAQSRTEANALCNRIHGIGGACIVLRT